MPAYLTFTPSTLPVENCIIMPAPLFPQTQVQTQGQGQAQTQGQGQTQGQAPYRQRQRDRQRQRQHRSQRISPKAHTIQKGPLPLSRREKRDLKRWYWMQPHAKVMVIGGQSHAFPRPPQSVQDYHHLNTLYLAYKAEMNTVVARAMAQA